MDADGVVGRRDPSADRQTKIVMEADSDVRLDLLVAARAGLSRTAAATLIANGHVTVDGRRERASYKPRAGECLTIAPPPARERAVEPEAIPLQVVFEDDDVLVVDKPAGMVVHPAPGNWRGTLVNALLGRAIPLSAIGGAERAGLVHRLDKETSGLVLVAKTERAHRVLGAALAARRIDRRYAALCWGHLSDDVVTVDRPVARDPRNRQRMAIVASGKTARTTLVRLARFDSVDLLHAQLHTGRTHQIRVHLAHLGHPVVGDDVYGGGGGRRLLRLLARRHFLHAAWLRFRHPTTNSLIDLRSRLPIDLREVVSVVAEQVVPDPLMAYAFFNHPLVPLSSVEN